ncbi:MAG: hypothetical protein AAB602_02165, partial [Patescibacteria group bacterium]
MFTAKEWMDKYPEVFKKIGGIIYNLNQIEVFIISALSTFFIDLSDPHSEKTFIFNDSLSDEAVFPNLENKRRLLIRVIKGVSKAAEENGMSFDKSKWLNICESVRKLQELRNELAHHHLLFLQNGNIGYYIRKNPEELLQDKKIGKTGSMKLIEIDLDKEFEKSGNTLKESEPLMAELSTDALNILIEIAWKKKVENVTEMGHE